jgi:hypothetical protein
MRHVDTSDSFAGDANYHLNRQLTCPSLIQTHDGLLPGVYSSRTREYIHYARVSEAWVRHEVTHIRDAVTDASLL